MSAKRDACLRAISRWAQESPIVSALILTGSLARADGTADEWSDLDVEVISSEPPLLLSSEDWLGAFGSVRITMRLNGDEHHPWPTRLVIYASGVRADFTIAV